MQTCSVRAHLNWNNMAIMNEQNEVEYILK